MIDQALAVESGIPWPNAIAIAWIIQVKIQWINCGVVCRLKTGLIRGRS